MNPLIARYQASLGASASKMGDPMLKRIALPLLFEPGTGWEYGFGLDWAGVIVMRLNNTSLESYMHKHIWDPLGIKNITFHQELKPEVRKNLVKMSTRGNQPLRGLAVATDEKVQWTDELLYEDPQVDEFGGAGAVGSAGDYLRILHSIAADDGKLLTSETIEEMFSPQLSAEAQRRLNTFINFIGDGEMFSAQEPGAEVNYGLGGLLILGDKKTGVRSGTLSWSGLPNLLWTIDRNSGLCLFCASNLCPFGDQKSQQMQQVFEREMYTRASKL